VFADPTPRCDLKLQLARKQSLREFSLRPQVRDRKAIQNHLNPVHRHPQRKVISMNLSQLLASRSSLLRQASLANAAFSYAVFCRLGQRIARAGISGLVRLSVPDSEQGAYGPTVIALTGSQSVLEEHFDEADWIRLADALAYTTPNPVGDIEFHLEELSAKFGNPLRCELEAAGIECGDPSQSRDWQTRGLAE
jgi:hypothetical protein